MGVTQPAISAAMTKLSSEVGFELFRREGRILVLTAEAEQLERDARRVVSAMAELESSIAGISTARRGVLAIASSPGAGTTWLPGAIARFREARPDVTIRLLTRNSREVRNLVLSNGVDVGVAQPPFDNGDNVIRRFRTSMLCVLPANHALCAHDVITPTLLDGVPFIALAREMSTRAAIAETFDAVNAKCNVVVEVEYFATAINLVADNVGVAVSEPVTARHMSHPGVTIRPYVPDLTYELGLLVPGQTEPSRLASAFIETVVDHFSQLLNRGSN